MVSSVFSGDEVAMSGNIDKAELTIQHIAIYYDNPACLTVQQLANPPYSGGYDMGTYVGMVLPAGWESVRGITITANTWHQSGQHFEVKFNLSGAFDTNGRGVYTLCLQSNLENTDTEDNSLSNYSVWHS